jgi:uncharacterized protein (DUF433 family)
MWPRDPVQDIVASGALFEVLESGRTGTRVALKQSVRREPFSQSSGRAPWRYNPIVANSFDRITQSPNVLAGRATIRGLRISVAHVVNLVANGMTPAQIIADLPDLEEEDVRQALAYAAALAQDELHTLRA